MNKLKEEELEFMIDLGELMKKMEEIKNMKPIDSKLDDLNIPGAVVSLEPEQADEMGAFEETAVSFEDAKNSVFDADSDIEIEEGQ